MVQKMRWKLWVVIVGAALLAVFYYSAIQGETEKEPDNYSVILYQHTDNEWAIFTEGMKQAEDDLRIKVNYITMGENDTAKDQVNMIEREIKAGADGILIAAVDSDSLRQELGAMSLAVPVICAETGVGAALPVISAEDYEMGKALGNKILKDMDANGQGRVVTILREYMERDSVRQRYEGLRDALEAADEKVEIQEYSRSPGDYSLRLFVETLFHSCGQYIAALDKYTTEEAGAARASDKAEYEADGMQFQIYGIGNTVQTVNDLDNGNIQALVYQNEFNMGYQGLKCLAEARKKDWIDRNINIKFELVTKETLYEYENERLLFPSV